MSSLSINAPWSSDAKSQNPRWHEKWWNSRNIPSIWHFLFEKNYVRQVKLSFIWPPSFLGKTSWTLQETRHRLLGWHFRTNWSWDSTCLFGSIPKNCSLCVSPGPSPCSAHIYSSLTIHILLMVQTSGDHQLRLVVDILLFTTGFVHSRWLAFGFWSINSTSKKNSQKLVIILLCFFHRIMSIWSKKEQKPLANNIFFRWLFCIWCFSLM